MRAWDAVMRCRCKIILSLVQGKAPTMIAKGGLCAKSQVYRVADRFIEYRPVGLADRREDNGENKVTDTHGVELLWLIEGLPQEYGYRRPTWTQELLVLVLAEQTGIRVSVTTMCRLLRQLGIRLDRPKPTISCPWPRLRRTRRLRAIQWLIDNLAAGEVVVYLDKSTFTLIPRLGQSGRWPESRNTSALRHATRSVTSPALSIPKPASSHGSKGTERTASCSWISFTNS